MTDKEGTLILRPTGRWAICRPGRSPVEVTSGPMKGRELWGQTGEYYSVDGTT
jgi:hypothetical protein